MPLQVSTLEHNIGLVAGECTACKITGEAWKERAESRTHTDSPFKWVEGDEGERTYVATDKSGEHDEPAMIFDESVGKGDVDNLVKTVFKGQMENDRVKFNFHSNEVKGAGTTNVPLNILAVISSDAPY